MSENDNNDSVTPSGIIARIATGDDKELTEAIRDGMFEIFRRHESGAQHTGEPCGYNRAGFIAWLAHSAALGTEHIDKIVDVLLMYERECPCGVPTLQSKHFAAHE